MRHLATIILLVSGVAMAAAPEQPQQVLVQFSVGTGSTVVGLRILRQLVPIAFVPANVPGHFCLRLPFGCAMVMESASPDGSGVVVRPQVGPLAFEVAVGPARTGNS